MQNETTFLVNLTDNSTYEGNCLACDISNNCNFSESNYTFNIDTFYNAPPQIILQYPKPSGVQNIERNVTLNVTVIDPEGTSMNVTFYGREKNNTNFTIIVLPDTQHYSRIYPIIFDNQTLWINSSKNDLNIVFITHEGDIVDNQTIITQWQNANHSMSILDGRVSYGLGPGNHDMWPRSGGGNTTNYNTYFPVYRFISRSEWGGNFDRNDNNYQLFSAGGQDFIIIHIEFDANGTNTATRNPVYTWVNNTLETYWNRSAIITTHDYLNTTGSRTSFGGDLWDHVITTHPNVFLVLAGHNHGEWNRSDNNLAGKPVIQLLADYQDYSPYGGNGFLRIMKFVPYEWKIEVKTYSPYLNQYETDTNSQFNLVDYSRYLGRVLNVASNTNATFNWTNLKSSTTYEWFIEVVDGDGVKATSNVWNFTTGSS